MPVVLHARFTLNTARMTRIQLKAGWYLLGQPTMILQHQLVVTVIPQHHSLQLSGLAPSAGHQYRHQGGKIPSIFLAPCWSSAAFQRASWFLKGCGLDKYLDTESGLKPRLGTCPVFAAKPHKDQTRQVRGL